MSKEFYVWVDEVVTKKVWFVADSIPEAEDLIRQVEEGELDITALPAYDFKVKGDSVSFGFVEEDN